MKDRRAVCLISGGLDSAVAATIAKCERFDIYALTFDYGQRHKKEIAAAEAVAKSLRAKEHKVLKIPIDAFGGSALTDPKIPVPKGRTMAQIGTGIPSTYVPARNTIFLAFGLSYAESVGAGSVFIGAHALDYSGYPDCRPEYFEAYNEVAKLGTKAGVDGRSIRVHAPLVGWTKTKIVETGHDLKAPMNLTWSCYEGGETACGRCDSCQLRLRAFAEAGLKDAVAYGSLSSSPPLAPAKKQAKAKA
ncbi:MAG TPA: 7-cyano-7-deazaguanine synthase QueC [Candidatus Thermoplasmatota archaeon]|nr:7-cyano-7-deazaguanine synthase QueC [Candidatus Thermoplasmatota archaeon]